MEKLLELVSSTPNSGRVHLFLGNPLSDGGDKTVVEPGNTTSPGVWSCGISLWWETPDEATSPDRMPPDAIDWMFGGEDGLPPEVTARYEAFGRHVWHRLAHLGAEGAEGVDFHIVSAGAGPAMNLNIVVKSEGPAGKTLRSLRWDDADNTLVIGGAGIQLIPETKPNIVRNELIGGEPVAALGYSLAEGEAIELAFKVIHRYDDHPLGSALPVSRHARLTVRQGFETARKEWQQALPTRIFAPDRELVQAWERCCAHILNAMELGIPRIGAVHYPLFWMRDGVLVLRALDLMGRHDLARIGCEALAPVVFSGGFGAEADAPGEGIWALTEHARLTSDNDWLRTIFPAIEQRAGIIAEMTQTTKIMRGLSECRAPMYVDSPTNNIICLPARDGLIHGRMDHHSPDFFINLWAWRGLSDAACAARLLKKDGLADLWQQKAEALAQAIQAQLLPDYGGNERDSIVTPHPCGMPWGWEEIREVFQADFIKRRLAKGKRIREPLWTYFEAAQIHNAMLLGMREEAWVCLSGMLSDGFYDATIYTEGDGSDPDHDLKFGNGAQRRGWLSRQRAIGGNMPHNWTNAEMVALIRDIFVTEEADGLRLCGGVPDSWRAEGAEFGVRNLPTALGPVSFTARFRGAGLELIDYDGPECYSLDRRKE